MKHPIPLPRVIRRWLRAETGAVSVEAVIMFPLLLWAYGAMFVFFDAFKAQNLNVKAAYTIADTISREPDPIDRNYIDGLNTIYGFLIDPRNFRGVNQDIVISVVSNRLNASGEEELQLDWSCATGVLLPHEDLNLIADQIPIMAVDDQVILVQARMDWEPPLNFGLRSAERRNSAVARPRFVPQIQFDGTC